MSDNLPVEIVTEILSRLPVKSLLCFRSVSKQWHSIISNPQFATTQASHAPSKVIVLFPSTARTFSSFLPVVNDHDGLIFPAWEDSVPSRIPDVVDSRINGLSSCNGLLCLHSFQGSTSNLILWNPSLRRYIKLREHQHISRCFYHVYGLGFDSVNNDYKVLEIELTWRASHARYCSTAYVFSMNRKSWEKVSDFPYYIAYNSSIGAWTNGSLHFIGRRVNETSFQNSGMIIAFHLATKETHFVPLPEDIGTVSGSTSLSVLHGTLCVVENRSSDECYCLWLMEEYGVKSSWAPLATIPYSSLIGGCGIFPFAETGDGEILLSTKEGELRLYDPKENRAMNVIKDVNGKSRAVCLYEETLVCLLTRTNEPEESPERRRGVRWIHVFIAATLLCSGVFVIIFTFAK